MRTQTSSLTVFNRHICSYILLGFHVFVICRYYKAKRRSSMVVEATSALETLRSENPDLYPLAQHVWYKLKRETLAAPVLCAGCMQRIQPGGESKVNQVYNKDNLPPAPPPHTHTLSLAVPTHSHPSHSVPPQQLSCAVPVCNLHYNSQVLIL